MSAITKLFDKVYRRFKNLGANASVTKRAASYGSRCTTTGWRLVTYNNSTIVMPIASRTLAHLVMPAGIYAYHDAVGLTTTSMVAGDQVMDADNLYYEVRGVKPHKVGNKTAFYECQLAYLPVWQLAPAQPTWSKTRPQDARRRIKAYIDTNARSAQITKDDDSTAATFATIYANPPYPLEKEFRAASTPVFGLYVVGEANSTALLDFDQTPSHYEEHVPVHVCTVDSTACTGTHLKWKMEAELRYVCEQNPTGSQISLERRGDHDRNIGSLWLYDTEFVLSYVRDLTT